LPCASVKERRAGRDLAARWPRAARSNDDARRALRAAVAGTRAGPRSRSRGGACRGNPAVRRDGVDANGPRQCVSVARPLLGLVKRREVADQGLERRPPKAGPYGGGRAPEAASASRSGKAGLSRGIFRRSTRRQIITTFQD